MQCALQAACLLQMLPVVVEDDFDEGPPEEHADQDEAASTAVLPLDNADPYLESSLTHDHMGLTRVQVSTAGNEVQAASADAAPLSEKEARKAEKAQAAAAKLCCMCGEKADAKWLTCSCSARTHIECLAKHFLQVSMPCHANGVLLEQT